MEDLLNYLVDDALVMIIVLRIIGKQIKNTTIIADTLIPPALTLISIGFTPLLLGGYTPANIVQAILVAGGSVLVDQTIKQSRKPE